MCWFQTLSPSFTRNIRNLQYCSIYKHCNICKSNDNNFFLCKGWTGLGKTLTYHRYPYCWVWLTMRIQGQGWELSNRRKLVWIRLTMTFPYVLIFYQRFLTIRKTVESDWRRGGGPNLQLTAREGGMGLMDRDWQD